MPTRSAPALARSPRLARRKVERDLSPISGRDSNGAVASQRFRTTRQPGFERVGVRLARFETAGHESPFDTGELRGCAVDEDNGLGRHGDVETSGVRRDVFRLGRGCGRPHDVHERRHIRKSVASRSTATGVRITSIGAPAKVACVRSPAIAEVPSVWAAPTAIRAQSISGIAPTWPHQAFASEAVAVIAASATQPASNHRRSVTPRLPVVMLELCIV